MKSKWHKKKEFCCPYCDASFKKSRMLKSHIKDAHADKLQNIKTTDTEFNKSS